MTYGSGGARFGSDDVDIPVARLADIVTSKAAAGRKKDRLFLATHAEAIRQMQRQVEPNHPPSGAATAGPE